MDITQLFAEATAGSITSVFPMKFHQYTHLFCAENGLELNETGVFAFWVTAAMARVDASKITIISNVVSTPPVPVIDTGFDVAGNSTANARFSNGTVSHATLAHCEAAFTAKSLNETEIMQARVFFASKGPVLGMFRDLVACHQVSPLSTENLDNFFLMRGGAKPSTRTIKALLDAASPMIGQLPGTADLSKNPFMAYHTAASSTPQIVLRVMQDLGTVGNNIFTTGEIDAVNAANAALHDLALSRLIPNRAIQVAYCYLEANSALPGNWYQGIKAITAYNAAARSATVAFFKKLAATSFSVNEMEVQTSTILVLAKAPAGLMQGDALAAAEINAATDEIAAMRARIDTDTLIEINEKRVNAGQNPLTAVPEMLRASKSDARRALARDV